MFAIRTGRRPRTPNTAVRRFAVRRVRRVVYRNLRTAPLAGRVAETPNTEHRRSPVRCSRSSQVIPRYGTAPFAGRATPNTEHRTRRPFAGSLFAKFAGWYTEIYGQRRSPEGCRTPNTEHRTPPVLFAVRKFAGWYTEVRIAPFAGRATEHRNTEHRTPPFAGSLFAKFAGWFPRDSAVRREGYRTPKYRTPNTAVRGSLFASSPGGIPNTEQRRSPGGLPKHRTPNTAVRRFAVRKVRRSGIPKLDSIAVSREGLPKHPPKHTETPKI